MEHKNDSIWLVEKLPSRAEENSNIVKTNDQELRPWFASSEELERIKKSTNPDLIQNFIIIDDFFHILAFSAYADHTIIFADGSNLKLDVKHKVGTFRLNSN